MQESNSPSQIKSKLRTKVSRAFALLFGASLTCGASVLVFSAADPTCDFGNLSTENQLSPRCQKVWEMESRKAPGLWPKATRAIESASALNVQVELPKNKEACAPPDPTKAKKEIEALAAGFSAPVLASKPTASSERQSPGAPAPAEKAPPPTTDTSSPSTPTSPAALTMATAQDPESGGETPSQSPATNPGDTGQKSAPLRQGVGSSMSNFLNQSANAAEYARGREFYTNVIQSRNTLTARSVQDGETLAKPYVNVGGESLATSLKRAIPNLRKMADAVVGGTATQEGLRDKSESFRFAQAMDNATELAQNSIEILEQAKPGNNGTNGFTTPGTLLHGISGISDEANPGTAGLAQGDALSMEEATAAARELIGLPPLGSAKPKSDRSPASGPTQLAQRYAQFAGLSDEQQKEALEKLNLIESETYTTRDGQKVAVHLLHNGYVLGAGKTGKDCSSLVSEAIPSEVRAGRLTTLDFALIWNIINTSSIPRPPKIEKNREMHLMRVSKAFNSVNIWRGEPLAPGDLLVFRIPWKPIGHVFVIKDYDPETKMAQVVEASQSASGIRERPFRVTLGPKSSVVRPGLFALRLKPKSNEGCSYADDHKSPQKEKISKFLKPGTPFSFFNNSAKPKIL